MNRKVDYRPINNLNYKNYLNEISYKNNQNDFQFNYNNYNPNNSYITRNNFYDEREININRNIVNRKQKKIYKTPERNSHIYRDRSAENIINNIRDLNNLNNSRKLYTKYNNSYLNKSSTEGIKNRNLSDNKNSNLAYSMRNNNNYINQMRQYQNLYNNNYYNFTRTPSPIRRDNLKMNSNNSSNQKIGYNNKKEGIVVDLKKSYKDNYINDYGSKSSSNVFINRNNNSNLIDNNYLIQKYSKSNIYNKTPNPIIKNNNNSFYQSTYNFNKNLTQGEKNNNYISNINYKCNNLEIYSSNKKDSHNYSIENSNTNYTYSPQETKNYSNNSYIENYSNSKYSYYDNLSNSKHNNYNIYDVNSRTSRNYNSNINYQNDNKLNSKTQNINLNSIYEKINVNKKDNNMNLNHENEYEQYYYQNNSSYIYSPYLNPNQNIVQKYSNTNYNINKNLKLNVNQNKETKSSSFTDLTTNTFTFDNQGTNNSHLSSNHIDTVEEVHINFVKMIQNTKYLLKVQENIKNTIYNDKYQNSSLIYVNEEIIN